MRQDNHRVKRFPAERTDASFQVVGTRSSNRFKPLLAGAESGASPMGDVDCRRRPSTIGRHLRGGFAREGNASLARGLGHCSMNMDTVNAGGEGSSVAIGWFIWSFGGMIFDFACLQLSSLWERLVGAIGDAAGGVLGRVVESIRTLFEGDPETRRQVSFSVAIIALSAKMAKADGIVTEAEVRAFQQIFDFPDEEARHVARLYNLARQDVAGYEAYASKLAGLCSSGARENCPMLENVVDGLFHIAKADGLVHEKELLFLGRIATIFKITDDHFRRIMARHIHLEGGDPYLILGVSPQDDFAAIRKQYRLLVSEHHPDRLIARGVPASLHAAAHDRMAALNAAYETIEKERRAA
jgi:DnaJ like chaperone protein